MGLNLFWARDSLRKSSSDLSCKTFTEIVGSGTVKKPLLVSSGGVKKILDRKLQKAALDENSNKSSYKLIKEASVLSKIIFFKTEFFYSIMYVFVDNSTISRQAYLVMLVATIGFPNRK